MEKDKERFLISILGEQKLDGETDKIEVLTAGNFMKKKDHYYIGYREYDEDNPETFFNNLIKVEGDMVTINRKGPMRSQLMLEKGRRHQCIYQTVAGDGTLEVSYTLDFNTDLVSENRFFIKIEEKQNTAR